MTDEDAWNEGYQEGYQKGQEEGQTEADEEARASGYEEGYEKGYDAALEEKGTQEWSPDNVMMEKALEECKAALDKMSATAEGDNAFLWALAELMKHIAAVTYGLEEKPW